MSGPTLSDSDMMLGDSNTEGPDNKAVKTESRLAKQLCSSADLRLILELEYDWP